MAIKDDWRQQVSVIVPEYSQSRGRRLDVSREDLATALQTNFSGRTVGVYREADRLIPIVTRAPENEHRQLALADLLRGWVPSQLAHSGLRQSRPR